MSMATTMEDDFDFLRYLDFGTSNPPLSAGGSNSGGAIPSFMSSIGGSYGGGLHSNYASPQDTSTTKSSTTGGSNSSEWSVSSPSGSNVSFPKSPLFGSMSMNTSNASIQQQQQPSLFDSSFSWDPIKAYNNSSVNSSIPSQSSVSSGNSPPFDLSIYGPSTTLSDENSGSATNINAYDNSSSNSLNMNNGGSYGNPNMSDSNNSAALTQQWQQLLFQQAQLQLQMQLQNGNNDNQPSSLNNNNNQVSPMPVPMPVQQGQFNIPFPQVQAMHQQPQQHRYTQSQSSQGQYQASNGMNSMQNTPQVQPTAQFQISTEDWSSRLPSANGNNVSMHHQQQQQPQQSQQFTMNQNVVPTPSPPASATFAQSQSMPAPYMPMHAQQQQYQAQRSLSPTEIPLNMQSAPKPIAPLPKRESMGVGVAVMPTGAAQHVSSVKNNKIAKTGLKRSYQQVKQEDASDEDSKRHHAATTATSMSRSASAETSSGSGNDSKGEKKTPGGHNAVEQKYRRGINDSLITLREIVPALQHLRVLPGMENAQRKQSQFSLSASVTPAAPSGFVDGVMAPTKLSKQLILVTATDYIKFLQNRRSELEGELESYKNAIFDCVEDPQVVLNLAESRWYPVRMQILKDRENIYHSRVASKEQSKKQAKLERQKNASTRKSDGTGGNNGDGGGSDDDDDDDEDEDDEEMEGQEMATSSAVPAKAQAKPRGRKPANNKKASSPRKKANTGNAPSGNNSNDNGSSKALMSVFAGVSFVGGAGYDILFGSSGSAASTGSETVSPGQVWSRGNILRRGITSPLPVPLENTQDLPALQAFFIRRPALLSGLVMLSLAVIIGYISFYVIPSLWKRVNGSAQEARRVRARETLVQKTKMPASVDSEEEIKALATLAGAPTGLIAQILSLPLLISNFVISFLSGGIPTHFDMSSDEYSIEEAASSVKLLEMSSHNRTYFSKLVAFLHLYNLTRSTAWPVSKSSIPLLARAQAVLALTSVELFGDRVSKKASSTWQQAQDLLKKEDNVNGWLSFALGSTFEGARLANLTSGNPIFDVAEARAQSILSRAWPAVFTEVVNATTFTSSTRMDGASATISSSPSAISSSTASKVAEIDSILNCMPPTSPSYALALLAKGIQALGKNDKATAVNVALHLAPIHAQSLASVRAFSSLVSGHPEPASFGDAAAAGVDTLAYSTIAWLSIRQLAKASLSTSAVSAKKTETKDGEDEDDDSHIVTDEAGLQMATIRLRKLLATEAFTSDVDEGFMDAQDRCVEHLVNIGRQAAGLDALSDSGCEL